MGARRRSTSAVVAAMALVAVLARARTAGAVVYGRSEMIPSILHTRCRMCEYFLVVNAPALLGETIWLATIAPRERPLGASSAVLGHAIAVAGFGVADFYLNREATENRYVFPAIALGAALPATIVAIYGLAAHPGVPPRIGGIVTCDDGKCGASVPVLDVLDDVSGRPSIGISLGAGTF